MPFKTAITQGQFICLFIKDDSEKNILLKQLVKKYFITFKNMVKIQ